jgi:hypothetical protein
VAASIALAAISSEPGIQMSGFLLADDVLPAGAGCGYGAMHRVHVSWKRERDLFFWF